MNLYLKKFINDTFSKPGKALDLGAGEFFDIACLKQLGWKAEGVDIKTGTNLEEPFLSKNKPFDLVYSNYVIHKLKNKEPLVKTAYDNLKIGGWFFLHTFDKSDTSNKNRRPEMSKEIIASLLDKVGFKNTSTKVFSFYDNENGHKHWHRILEATAQK